MRPHAQQRPAATAHQAGQTGRGSPRVTNTGSEANPTAYGSGDSGVCFSRRL
ncbi:hypothetical protein SALBM217S_05224 [Streptomyces griseoloalbus]